MRWANLSSAEGAHQPSRAGHWPAQHRSPGMDRPTPRRNEPYSRSPASPAPPCWPPSNWPAASHRPLRRWPGELHPKPSHWHVGWPRHQRLADGVQHRDWPSWRNGRRPDRLCSRAGRHVAATTLAFRAVRLLTFDASEAVECALDVVLSVVEGLVARLRANAISSWRARRLARQLREGSPSVSRAARMRPPSRPRFFRKCIFCWARVVSSTSSQNRCPAYVVGMIEPIKTRDARRRNLPVANNVPATIWTAPFSRTSISVSSGTISTFSLRGAVTTSAFFAFPAGFRTASKPLRTKVAASKGRATRRDGAMAPFLTRCAQVHTLYFGASRDRFTRRSRRECRRSELCLARSDGPTPLLA